MAAAEGGCGRGGCPLEKGVEEDTGQGRLCLPLAQYPLRLQEGNLVVEIESEEVLPERFSEFLSVVFEPRDDFRQLDPLPFLRTFSGDRKRNICPGSWPTQPWERAIIEQIVADTSGMQPRFWYNEKPWLLQPAIYCECHMAVQSARKIADEWEEKNKAHERKKGPNVGSRG